MPCLLFFFFFIEQKRKPLTNKGFLYGGIKWARTIDLHDVNVAL